MVSGRRCQTLQWDVHRHCYVKDPSVIVGLSIRNFDHHDIEMTMRAHNLDWTESCVLFWGAVYVNESKT